MNKLKMSGETNRNSSSFGINPLDVEKTARYLLYFRKHSRVNKEDQKEESKTPLRNKHQMH